MKLINRIMVRIAVVNFLALGLVTTTGCAHTGSTPASLPVGALNTFDADTYRVLADAHALVQSLSDQTRAGTLVLSPVQKDQLNDMIVSMNTADHLYKAYKASGGVNVDTTALSQATAAVLADIGKITQLVKGN